MDFSDSFYDIVESSKVNFDSADTSRNSSIAEEYAEHFLVGLAVQSVFAVQTWAEKTVDLGENENQADRLFALIIGIIDEDKNGEVSEDEQYFFDLVIEYVAQYLISLDVDINDVKSLLENWSSETAEKVCNFISGKISSDESQAIDSVISFVVGGGVTFDSATRKEVVFRNGKKTVKNKRIGGKFVMSAKHKVALAKNRMKSKSTTALKKLSKSLKARAKAGY